MFGGGEGLTLEKMVVHFEGSVGRDGVCAIIIHWEKVLVRLIICSIQLKSRYPFFLGNYNAYLRPFNPKIFFMKLSKAYDLIKSDRQKRTKNYKE